VEAVAFQDSLDRFPAIPREAFERAVHLIEPDGTISTGAEAVFRCLRHAKGFGWIYPLYRRFPGFRPASEAAYRFIAGHRPLFHRLTILFFGRRPPGRT
jgi:predicted DCC family thiol-disulfide oxidoreductase YuxK